MGFFKKTTPKVRKLEIVNEEDWTVEIKIGDKVMDVYGDQGSFHVEKINSDGWVWGSDMKTPYYDGYKKNYVDYHVTWVI